MVLKIKATKVQILLYAYVYKKKSLENKGLLAQITLNWWDIENKPIRYISRFV
jgi:hypothetical protein